MTLYHTLELGWSLTDDIGPQMTTFFDSLKPGDMVGVEDGHQYKFSGGNFQLPENVMMFGIKGGNKVKRPTCGFVCLDGFPNSQELYGVPYNRSEPVFVCGSHCIIDGLLFTHEHENLDLQLLLGGNARDAWIVSAPGAHNITVRNSYCDTEGWSFVAVKDSHGLHYHDNETRNLKHHVFLSSRSDNYLIERNRMSGGYEAPKLDGIQTNIFGDAVKTLKSNLGGPAYGLIQDNFMDKLTRDAFDTTGGSVGTKFRRNRCSHCGVDVKNIVDKPLDQMHPTALNDGLEIEDNLFVNSGIGLTTLWSSPDPLNEHYFVKNIYSRRNTHLGTVPDKQAWFFKDCHHFYSEDDVIIGMRQSKTATAYGIVRDIHAKNLTLITNGIWKTQVKNLEDSSFHYKWMEINDDVSNYVLSFIECSNLRITGTIVDNGADFGAPLYMRNDVFGLSIDVVAYGNGTKALLSTDPNTVTNQTYVGGIIDGFMSAVRLQGQNDNVTIDDEATLNVDQVVEILPTFNGTGLSYPGMSP